MSNYNAAYQMGSCAILLHDKEEDSSVDALVRSGDYFSTLASQLDFISSQLNGYKSVNILLEQHIRNLLYIESRYDIVRKIK